MVGHSATAHHSVTHKAGILARAPSLSHSEGAAHDSEKHVAFERAASSSSQADDVDVVPESKRMLQKSLEKCVLGSRGYVLVIVVPWLVSCTCCSEFHECIR